MYRLTATYQIKPEGNIRIKRATDDTMSYVADIGRFSVRVTLARDPKGAHSKWDEDKYEVSFLDQLTIIVSSEEDPMPPKVFITEKGERNHDDLNARATWLYARTEAYHETALMAANRIMWFFKYQMHGPLITEFDMIQVKQGLLKWTGEDGEDLTPSNPRPFVVTVIFKPQLGQRDFTADDDDNLQKALQNPLPVNSYQEFLADAQSSIVKKNMTRAVLEMAIACELAAKETFFSKTTPASAAFEYLEDKSRIPVRVIDLIDGAAKDAFGESFKDVAHDEYRDIDYLFRCRNKVAHRGIPSYRDDTGKVHEASTDELRRWWLSALKLIDWLDNQRS